MRTAIYDIGSNSVRLIVFEGDEAVFRGKINSRLGEGIAQSNNFSPAALQRTIVALEKLKTISTEHGVQEGGHFAFATEAVRKAKDGHLFLRDAQTEFGIKCRLLSGDEEAEVALKGVLGSGDGAVIDIGGASSELAVRIGGKIVYSLSLKAGAGTLTDEFGSDKAALDHRLETLVKGYGKLPEIKDLYAIGGTASACGLIAKNLKQYDYEAIDGLLLDHKTVYDISDRLFLYTAEQRQEIFHLDPNRAAVLPCGARLFAKVIEYVHPERVRVSERGNIEGYYSWLKEQGIV